MFFRYYFFFASSVISHSPLPGIDYIVMVDVDVEVPLKIEIWWQTIIHWKLNLKRMFIDKAHLQKKEDRPC